MSYAEHHNGETLTALIVIKVGLSVQIARDAFARDAMSRAPTTTPPWKSLKSL